MERPGRWTTFGSTNCTACESRSGATMESGRFPLSGSCRRVETGLGQPRTRLNQPFRDRSGRGRIAAHGPVKLFRPFKNDETILQAEEVIFFTDNNSRKQTAVISISRSNNGVRYCETSSSA